MQVDVLAKLARHRIANGTERFALEERIDGVAHEESVFAIHHAQPADHELVVQHDRRNTLGVSHGRAFLEGVDLYIGNGEAVECGTCLGFFFGHFIFGCHRGLLFC